MYVLGYLQSAYLFDIKPMCTQSQTLRANTFTREQTYVALRTYELYEHTCSVFPPIEQASAFTFAGRISAHGSILTLPTGWAHRYLKWNLLNEKQDRSIIEDMCS